MKTYVFKVVVEPDEDQWQAYCPILEKYAAYTWGYNREEALKNIKEVIGMILEELVEDNIPIPEETENEALVAPELRVAVAF